MGSLMSAQTKFLIIIYMEFDSFHWDSNAHHAILMKQFDVFILGKPHPAIQLAEAPFDPQGMRLRA